MPELSAEKKLQQLKKFLKIEKITSNTFVAEKIQLQTMIDLFCFDDILDKMLNYNYEKSMINNIDKILDNQILNYKLILKKMSIDIQYKFDKLYCNCLDIGFDIKPLQKVINDININIIDDMMYKEFFDADGVILENFNGLLSTLEWIDIIVNLLKSNYDERYKFNHCEHLFEKTQYLLVTTNGQIPICNICYHDIQQIFDKCPWKYFDFESFIRITPINAFYQMIL